MLVSLSSRCQCSLALRLCCFFQAEDGIRDLTVTGVQTCALPILAVRAQAGRGHPADGGHPVRGGRREIGRASCRERSVDLGGRRIIKKKYNKNKRRSAKRARRGRRQPEVRDI